MSPAPLSIFLGILAKPIFLSRVTPDKLVTIADLFFTSLLNKDDLPTFGRPIIASEEVMFKHHD